MNDKVFYIVISVYCVGFGMLGAQFLADSYGITLRAPDGTPLKSAIIDYIHIENLNQAVANVTSLQQTNSTPPLIDAILTATSVGYALGWELFALLFGFYIFNIMYLFGIPAIFIIPITGVYIILLVKTLIALIRGV